MPEQEGKEEPQVDRNFLFAVVNTCDPTYFPQQLERIEREKIEAAQKVKEDVIEIRPEIMQLLESFGAAAVGSSKRAGCARSLATLKKVSKKRSREEAGIDQIGQAPNSIN